MLLLLLLFSSDVTSIEIEIVIS